MKRKSWGLILAVSTLVTACGGEGGGGSPDESSGQESFRVGLVIPALTNPAINDLHEGVQAGVAETNIELLVTATDDGAQQAAAVESYVAAGVDLIMYDSLDAAAGGPAVEQANAADIPVLVLISAPATGEYVSFIGLPFVENGRTIGAWMAEELGSSGTAAVIDGDPAGVASSELVQGFLEAVSEAGLEDPLVSPPTNYSREEALNITTNVITANPDLMGLYGVIDEIAMGAQDALVAADREDVLVAGYNGTCEALVSLLEGEIDFTIMNFTRPLGELAVETAVQILNGEEVEEFVSGPTVALDRDTAEAYLNGEETAPSGLPVVEWLEEAEAGECA